MPAKPHYRSGPWVVGCWLLVDSFRGSIDSAGNLVDWLEKNDYQGKEDGSPLSKYCSYADSFSTTVVSVSVRHRYAQIPFWFRNSLSRRTPR